MHHSAFISYSRRTSKHYAAALHRALGGEGGIAFLDDSDIDEGEAIPPALVDALLSAKVVVAFVDTVYFERWYCLRELDTALRPFRWMVEHNRSKAQRMNGLACIILALPVAEPPSPVLERLPPALRTTAWHRADETAALATQVRSYVHEIRLTLAERLARVGELPAVRATVIEASSIPPPRALGTVPTYHRAALPDSIGERFAGRADDLWRIHTVLSTMRGGSEVSSATAVVKGGGGYGKTRLAVEYLRRFGPQSYLGGLFWLSAGSMRLLEEQHHGILRVLRPETPDLRTFKDAGRDASREVAETLRALPPDRRVLFVIDNVPEPQQGQSLQPLSRWCPAIGQVAVLATSRLDLSLGQPAVVPIRLDVLSDESAVFVLTAGLDRGVLSERDWSTIAAWVGHLPLALELLNAAISARGLSPRELRAHATTSRPTQVLDQQMEALRGQVSDDSLRGITQALDISYSRLGNARRPARLLACLGPEPIPVAVLQALGSELMPADARAALGARSFVTPVEPGEIDTYGRMHPVLADFLRSKSEDPELDATLVAEALGELFASDVQPSDSRVLAACQPHAEHVLALLGGSTSRRTIEAAVMLRLGIGVHLAQSGQYAAACAVLEDAAALAQRRLDKEDRRTLLVLNQLGWVHRQQGDPARGQTYLERVLALRERNLGLNDPLTAQAANDLAICHQDQMRYDIARRLLLQALDVRRRVLGAEHGLTAQSLSNVGLLLHEEGDLAAARPYLEEALAIRRRIHPEDHPDVAQSFNNLGTLLWHSGQLAEARQYLERNLQVNERLMGRDHPDVARALNQLAGVLFDQGDVTQSRLRHEHALDIRRRTLGAGHHLTAMSLANVGIVAREMGDLATARLCLEEALAIRQEVFGPDHRQTAWSLNHLGLVLMDEGDLEGARRLFERALAIRRQHAGPTHQETIQSLNNLARELLEERDLDGALAVAREALDSSVEGLGSNHPHTANSRAIVGRILWAHGDLRGAREQLARALDIRERVLGSIHMRTAETLDCLAAVLIDQGNATDAKGHLTRALSIYQRLKGPGHPLTMAAQRKLEQLV